MYVDVYIVAVTISQDYIQRTQRQILFPSRYKAQTTEY